MTTAPSSSRSGTRARTPFAARNVVGLVLMGLLGVADCASTAMTTPDGEVGPPLAISVADTVLGVVTVVAVLVALVTRSRGAVRVAAAARILSAVTALPAFFAGPPAPLVVAAAAAVVITVVAVVLSLSTARPAPVLD